MQRFTVSEDSMRPTLAPGDEFVVTRSRAPVAGELVALPHPGRSDFWLVKRLAGVPGDTVDGQGSLGPGQAWVTSDSSSAAASDSRSFGPVPFDSLLPVVTHLDEVTFLEAVELLAAEEPAFAAVLDSHGTPPFWQRTPGFATLVWLILEQQVSLESGAAMFRRVHHQLGEVTAEAMTRTSPEELRRIGVTRQKTVYLQELAAAFTAGRLDPGFMIRLPAAEARKALLAVKGIGAWTADAYLLSALRFPDVFPLGDRGLQVGTAEVLGMSAVPNEEELELLSLPWRPVRAAAARLIWHNYLGRRGRVEPPDPTGGHTPR